MSPDRRISDEVVGRFTEDQRAELRELGFTILQTRQLDPRNPDHIAQVNLTLVDCITRGLQAQGRQWFGSTEDVSPIFEVGLGEREIRIDQLNRIRTEGDHLHYISFEEGSAIQNLNPLDPDLTNADTLYSTLRARKSSIARFHQALFEESQLAVEARSLKASINVTTHPQTTNQDREWLKNNQLFANLIANLALYQQIDLAIEPKDIAALARMWSTPDTRKSKEEEIVTRIKAAAKTIGVNEQHVEVYTREILNGIDILIGNGDITIDDLGSSETFAIPSHILQEEAAEFEQVHDPESQTAYFPREDLSEARTVIATLIQMFRQMEQIADKTQTDEMLNDFIQNQYLPFFKQLTPLEFYLIYYQSFNNPDVSDKDSSRIDEELHEFIPYSTFLDALVILNARDHLVAETGEHIPEFNSNDEFFKTVQEAIEERILKGLLDDKFGADITYEQVVEKLPISTLTNYLSSINSSSLSPEHLAVIISQDPQKWLVLATRSNLRIEGDVRDEDKNVNWIFEPGSEFLRPYLGHMNLSQQKELAKKLQHIILF